MKFLGMKKVRDGKYLKNYELSYENKAGRLKTYEIVSRKELEDVQDLGRRASGVSIVAVSYTHLRAHETDSYLVCRLLLEKKKKKINKRQKK